MKAVIKTGGKQYLVEKGDKIRVEKMIGEAGDVVRFDTVLLTDDGKATTIGTPLVKGAVVTGSIVEQYKEEKKIIYKMKRRKRYRVKKGHRQPKTFVEIQDVALKGKKEKEQPVAKETKPKKEKQAGKE
ncbi:MAG: 50S ribosomal protein L21 [Candidatus Spechtbacteria bacterium SB0662_bin_43]|uniref:Large ribosomal subunit protein bL21 n=1 Tax=Candidatus Spechtbacteria bacterium SB0662_bin_43 TaxID=2604897 RepID=A0A845D8Y4_9BACT|nr:50S ribosomal protein L21 [Candidatus Spechtbacteria bacterium SB0662_bin_43]